MGLGDYLKKCWANVDEFDGYLAISFVAWWLLSIPLTVFVNHPIVGLIPLLFFLIFGIRESISQYNYMRAEKILFRLPGTSELVEPPTWPYIIAILILFGPFALFRMLKGFVFIPKIIKPHMKHR